MANKKELNMKFKLILDNSDGKFVGVNKFTPAGNVDFLGEIRKHLNMIYGFPVDAEPPVGFQDLTVNSFNMIEVDTEDIDDPPA